jgi:VWFA-related protein
MMHRINKIVYALGALGFAVLASFAQDLQHLTTVVNVEVPVRVFKGDAFVKDLTIDDFEIHENGVLQKIEALYQIRKTAVERRDERRLYAPATKRSFYLIFEIAEYDPRVEKAMRLFFERIFLPSDELVIVTPMKTYHLKSGALEKVTLDRTLDQLRGLLRRDVQSGNAEYRAALDELAAMAKAITASVTGNISGAGIETDIFGGSFNLDMQESLDEQLFHYSELLEKLESLRSIDEKRMLGFAKQLKTTAGQKFVFLFYQQEYVPAIDAKQYNYLTSFNLDRGDMIFKANELFGYRKRDQTLNADAVKKAFSDSSISVHFMFLTRIPDPVPGLQFEDRSEDIYNPFLEMAKATGGLAQSSANPEYLFARSSDAIENYYLLYYTPKDYKPDGSFKTISVKVKSGNYRVSYRSGYFAN